MAVRLLPVAVLLLWAPAAWGAEAAPAPQWPWWVLPAAFFLLTSVLGVLAVLAGIGGSVLFVPLVSGFAPFVHIDFVRAAGLLVALTGALSAGPGLVRQNLVNVRLAIPVSLMASVGSIGGALLGLALPVQVVQIALGVVILLMAGVMLLVQPVQAGAQEGPAGLARILGLAGSYWDAEQQREVTWYPRRLGGGLVLFSGVGVMAGMFGLGAGWANVPVLNLVMGVPLRFAVATSYFLLAITDTSAALIYFDRGALLPLIAVPSVLGIMLGARLGARLLVVTRTAVIRRVVIGVLLLAGARALLRGFGI